MAKRYSVLHKQIYRSGPFGGLINTTICGRVRNDSADYNVAVNDGSVTCKFCLSAIKRKKEASDDR